MSIEENIASPESVFKFLSYMDSIFKIPCCGNCQAPAEDLKFVHRNPQGYNYYSVQCTKCKHELRFSQQKPENGGKLYPKGWEEPYQGGAARDDTNQDQPETRSAQRAAPAAQSAAIPW